MQNWLWNEAQRRLLNVVGGQEDDEDVRRGTLTETWLQRNEEGVTGRGDRLTKHPHGRNSALRSRWAEQCGAPGRAEWSQRAWETTASLGDGEPWMGRVVIASLGDREPWVAGKHQTPLSGLSVSCRKTVQSASQFGAASQLCEGWIALG